MQDVGIEGPQNRPQPPEGEGIELRSLAKNRDGDAGCPQTVGIGTATGERDDMAVEAGFGQSGRQERKLTLGPRSVERGDQKGDTRWA